MSADPEQIKRTDLTPDPTTIDLVDRAKGAAKILEVHPCEVYYGAQLYADLANEVEALRNRVVKLNGWLDKHESMLAKSRSKMDDARRELKAAGALNREMVKVCAVALKALEYYGDTSCARDDLAAPEMLRTVLDLHAKEAAT